MTDPTDPRTDRPVMGDHPDLEEDDEVQRRTPPRARDRLSPMLMAAIAALIILVVVLVILAVV